MKKIKSKKRGIKKFNLQKEYKKSFNYVLSLKNFLWVIFGLFFMFSLIGFFIPAPEPVAKAIFKFIEELLKKTQDMSQFELINFIFLNNLQSSFFGVALGIVFGVFPLVVAILNGYLLGFVASLSVSASGVFSLWKILPHGIFELPAVFISLALGLKIGMFIFEKDKMSALKESFRNSVKVFVLIVLPLLFFAAIIEGTLIFLFS